MILAKSTTPLIPGNGAAGVAAEREEHAMVAVRQRRDVPGRTGEVSGDATHAHGQLDRRSSRFPLSANSDAAAGQAGRQPSEAIAGIIDHINPDGRTT
jgi:hypothetical protein